MNISRSLLPVPLLLALAATLSAQQPLRVTGRILDTETLAPIAGVGVSVEGGAARTVSEPGGHYTIQAPAGATLVFDALGRARHTAPVRDRAVIDVSLESSADEILVVGYADGFDRREAIDFWTPTQAYSAPTQTYLPAAPSAPVTYTISGMIESSTPSQLPINLIAALNGDAHLREMTLKSPGTRAADAFYISRPDPNGPPSFEATFGFATLEEFHAWYGGRGTALHEAIEQTAAEDFRFNLSVSLPLGSAAEVE